MADSLDLANRDPNGINPHLQVNRNIYCQTKVYMQAPSRVSDFLIAPLPLKEVFI